MGIFSKIKSSYNNYQDNQIKKKEIEEARKTKILSGEIEAISVSYNLEHGEYAYIEFLSDRMAIVEHIEEHTTGKTHKKGVIGRAIVGGVLLGPLGALGGAVTAGNKSESTTIQKTIERLDRIDNGKLIFTNRRIIFVGNECWQLSYCEVMMAEFKWNQLHLKYPTMRKGEHFIIKSNNRNDMELYYKGIVTNAAKLNNKNLK